LTDSIFAGIPGLDDETEFVRSPVNSEYENPDEEDDDRYKSLDDEKLEEQIRKLKIGNEKDLKNLIEKPLMIAVMGEIGQSIQNNFVDLAKRNANTWANLLGCPEREREIEQMIGDMIEGGINGVIDDIERLSDEGIFE
jgi:hypothetical protein